MLYKGKNLFKRPVNHGLQVRNTDNFQGSHGLQTRWENTVAAKNEKCNSATPGVERGLQWHRPGQVHALTALSRTGDAFGRKCIMLLTNF